MNVNTDNPMVNKTYGEQEPLHVVLDLDDTLTATAKDYTQAKNGFIEYVQHTLAPMWEPDGIQTVFEDIDTARIGEQDYAKERFPGSMEDAYREIADQVIPFYEGLTRDEAQEYAEQHVPDELQPSFEWLVRDHETVLSEENIDRRAERAFYIGWDVVDQFPSHYAADGFIGEDEDHVMDGSEVLAYFDRQDDVELHLLTAGVNEVQRPKMIGLDLERYFEDRIHVVDRDKTETLTDFANKYGQDNVVMVGNSMSSDIEPAQDAGVGQVYFHFHDWEHGRFENGVDTEDPRFMDVERLDELIDLHDHLTLDG